MDNLITTIKQLKKQFNINNIEDYQSLLLIIYNSLFIYEDQLTPQIKYQLFNLLDDIINQIQFNKNNPLSNTASSNIYPLLVFGKINEINIRNNIR